MQYKQVRKSSWNEPYSSCSLLLLLLLLLAMFSVTEMMLNRDPKDEMMKAFKLFDDDDSGKISLRNLKRVAR